MKTGLYTYWHHRILWLSPNRWLRVIERNLISRAHYKAASLVITFRDSWVQLVALLQAMWSLEENFFGIERFSLYCYVALLVLTLLFLRCFLEYKLLVSGVNLRSLRVQHQT